MLHPESHIDRLVTEAVTQGAEQIRSAERADLADRTAAAVVSGLIELGLAAGFLKPK